MTPDEVLFKLKNLGVTLSRSSLTRYEHQGLIPEPERGGGGPGGRFTNYPPQTVAEAFASWSLLHGAYLEKDAGNYLFAEGRVPKLSPNFVMSCRSIALGVLEDKNERAKYDEPLSNLAMVNGEYVWVNDYQATCNIQNMVSKIEMLAKYPLAVAMSEFGVRAWLNLLDKANKLVDIKKP